MLFSIMFSDFLQPGQILLRQILEKKFRLENLSDNEGCDTGTIAM